MLSVQRLLKSGTTLEQLNNQFGIKSKEQDGLIILDYDQIESNHCKYDQVVRECRGLVLNKDDWSVVAKSFDRFFNLDEGPDTDLFNWDDFSCYEKLDGSLIRIVYIDNDFKIFTRFSFADQQISQFFNIIWRDAVLQSLTNEQKECIKDHFGYTFAFEFTSPYNQVVQQHSESRLTLLAVFDNIHFTESNRLSLVKFSKDYNFYIPEFYCYNSLNEILKELGKLECENSTFEGFVLQDSNGIRLKVKNKFYLYIHRLSGNGNITNYPILMKIGLKGDLDEVLTYFPHIEVQINKVNSLINEDTILLRKMFDSVNGIVDQKEFALILQKFNSGLMHLFFSLKKNGSFTLKDVLDSYYEAEDLVIKYHKYRGDFIT